MCASERKTRGNKQLLFPVQRLKRHETSLDDSTRGKEAELFFKLDDMFVQMHVDDGGWLMLEWHFVKYEPFSNYSVSPEAHKPECTDLPAQYILTCAQGSVFSGDDDLWSWHPRITANTSVPGATARHPCIKRANTWMTYVSPTAA